MSFSTEPYWRAFRSISKVIIYLYPFRNCPKITIVKIAIRSFLILMPNLIFVLSESRWSVGTWQPESPAQFYVMTKIGPEQLTTSAFCPNLNKHDSQPYLARATVSSSRYEMVRCH